MSMEWQPIKTAPRDGTWVMLFCPDVPPGLEPTSDLTHWIAQWNYLISDWTDQDDCSVVSETDTTHWMPLPKPPEGLDQ